MTAVSLAVLALCWAGSRPRLAGVTLALALSTKLLLAVLLPPLAVAVVLAVQVVHQLLKGGDLHRVTVERGSSRSRRPRSSSVGVLGCGRDSGALLSRRPAVVGWGSLPRAVESPVVWICQAFMKTCTVNRVRLPLQSPHTAAVPTWL